MSWVAADLPARFRASRRELFAIDGLHTGREARLAGPSFEECVEGDCDPDRANGVVHGAARHA